MNQFERLAIFTVLEGIEGQLRGLKTLLAAGNSQPGQHVTTHVPQHDPMAPNHMNPEDEAAMAKHFGMLRQAEIEKMQQAAGGEYVKLWDETQEKMQATDGN